MLRLSSKKRTFFSNNPRGGYRTNSKIFHTPQKNTHQNFSHDYQTTPQNKKAFTIKPKRIQPQTLLTSQKYFHFLLFFYFHFSAFHVLTLSIKQSIQTFESNKHQTKPTTKQHTPPTTPIHQMITLSQLRMILSPTIYQSKQSYSRHSDHDQTHNHYSDHMIKLTITTTRPKQKSREPITVHGLSLSILVSSTLIPKQIR